MKYKELLSTAMQPIINGFELIRAKSEMDKFLNEKDLEIKELDLMILKAKSKNPIGIGEILGLMNKKDLAIRSFNQAKELKNELF